MKNTILLSALIAIAPLAIANTPVESLKQAPDMVCANHSNQDECRTALKAVMFGTYSFTALDEQCESSSSEVKAKMNAEMKEQCAAAKDVTEYLKTLHR